jgi:nitroreductase
METMKSITTWNSTRRFLDRPVEEEKLQDLLKSVQRAPSWGNGQCWRMIVIRNKETQKRLSELSWVESILAPMGYKSNPASAGLAEAPLVIALCADPDQSGRIWGMDYFLTDAGIASQNLSLAAHSLGLGTVFVGCFMEEEAKQLLKIPENVRLVGLFPIGYPQKKGSLRPRKEVNKITFTEQWGQAFPG